MGKAWSFLFLVSAMANLAVAETWTLKSNGDNNVGLSGATWTASDGVTTSTTLNPDDDYITAATIYISSAKDNNKVLNTFTGHSLTIGTLGEAASKRRRIYDYGGHNGAWFENEGLILANGELLQHYYNNEHKIYGKITVTASAEVPFLIHNNYSYTLGFMSFYGPLCGSGHLLVRMGANESNAKFYTLSLKGTASGFTGGIELESRYEASGALCQSALSLPYGDMPAAVTVGTNSVLTASAATNVCAVKSLSLADKAEYQVKVERRTDAGEPYFTNNFLASRTALPFQESLGSPSHIPPPAQ